MIELSVRSVLYSLLSPHRIVLLQEIEGERYLPIWIGQYEAEAIAMCLQGQAMPRPLTHDLLVNLIEQLDGEIQYVVVNDLTKNTFYAGIAVEHDHDVRLVDSRPSDAIALAVRVSAPIFAEESVMEQAGIVRASEIRDLAGPPPDVSLDVFRDFVDSLDLDDLGD